MKTLTFVFLLGVVTLNPSVQAAEELAPSTELMPVVCTELAVVPKLSVEALVERSKMHDEEAIRRIELRVALAEIMRIGSGAIETKGTIELFNDVILGNRDPFNDRELRMYREFFEQLVHESEALRRLNSEKEAEALGGVQLSKEEIFSKRNSVFYPRQTIWQWFRSNFGKKPIDFRLATTFAIKLRQEPPKKRIKALKRSLGRMPPLTLGEVFEIAAAFDGVAAQNEALRLLESKLATPASMFPVESLLMMSSVLEPSVRKTFFYAAKIRLKKSEVIRMTLEQPQLLKWAAEAGIAGEAIKEEDFPEVFEALRGFGESPTDEQLRGIIALAEGLASKKDKAQGLEKILTLKLTQEQRSQVEQVIANLSKGPAVSVEEMIMTARAKSNYEDRDKLLLSYSKKYVGVLTLPEIRKLLGDMHYNDLKDKMVDGYFKEHIGELRIPEAANLTKYRSNYEDRDKMLLSYARHHRGRLNPEDFRSIAGEMHYSDLRDKVLGLLEH